MNSERFKEILRLIQSGEIDTVPNDELDFTLQRLTSPGGEDILITHLSDGSTVFTKMVLQTLLKEKARRSEQYSRK